MRRSRACARIPPSNMRSSTGAVIRTRCRTTLCTWSSGICRRRPRRRARSMRKPAGTPPPGARASSSPSSTRASSSDIRTSSARKAGGRILPGYDFVSVVAAANDGDGRDADASDPGDWVTPAEASAGSFRGCTAGDSSWHGTRVAGIVAARTNNSEGIAGTTWSPWVLPVRALGKCGGFDSDIMSATLWAAGIHLDGVPDNPYPAKIVNLSLGSTGPCTAAYRDVISLIAASRRARGRICRQ